MRLGQALVIQPCTQGQAVAYDAPVIHRMANSIGIVGPRRLGRV